MVLFIFSACGLVDVDLHPIGCFDPRIAISPGHLFRVREELCACLLKYPGNDSSIGNRKRQDHAAALRTLLLFDHSKSKTITVELNNLVKVLNRIYGPMKSVVWES